jgi:hypothetical protein
MEALDKTRQNILCEKRLEIQHRLHVCTATRNGHVNLIMKIITEYYYFQNLAIKLSKASQNS